MDSAGQRERRVKRMQDLPITADKEMADRLGNMQLPVCRNRGRERGGEREQG